MEGEYCYNIPTWFVHAAFINTAIALYGYSCICVAMYIHSYVEFLFSQFCSPVFHITVTVVSQFYIVQRYVQCLRKPQFQL